MAAPAEAAGAVSESSTDAQGNRSGSSYTTYLNDREDIAKILKILKNLRDLRATLQIRFEGDATSYSAKILDLAGERFLLEGVQPRQGLKHMRAGAIFSMSVRSGGMYLHSGTNVIESEHAERGLPYFSVRIADTVLYQQRRKSERLRLPLKVATNGASISLYRQSDPDKPMDGRIIDISAGGCRVEFDSPAVPPLEQDEPVHTALRIPKLLELSAEGAVRHFAYSAERKLICGIELIEMHVTDRRRLEQFIESIRR